MSETSHHNQPEPAAMSGDVEFRIEYTIQRRRPGDDDFAEIGFGSSGAWGDVVQCAHMVASDIDNNAWETEPGMPDPAEVGRDTTEAPDA